MAVVVPALNEIFEAAYDRIGKQMRSGYQLQKARRALNFLLLDWQNRGLNLFTIESGTLSLVEDQATYSMPSDTIDLIEHQLRTGSGTSQLDRTLTRVSVSDYAKQGSKNQTGAPTQIYVNRQATEVTVTMWPIPDASTYTMFYYRLKGIDGLESGIGTTAAVPPRFVPSLVSGLAYMLSMENADTIRLTPGLKEVYEGDFQRASEEDQETAPYFLKPWVGGM